MTFSSSLLSAFPDITYGFLGKNEATDLPLILLDQVHASEVLTVTDNTPYSSTQNPLPKADAWVTHQKNTYLGIKTADCVPVLFYDPKAVVIGAAHAGWRGSLAGIVENTVEAMKQLGASPSSIRAVIGPAIAVENYEVGGEVYDLFIQKDPLFSQFFTPLSLERTQKYLFNLKEFVRDALYKTGIPYPFIEVISANTYTEEALYSHRYAMHQGFKRAGDNISFIGIS